MNPRWVSVSCGKPILEKLADFSYLFGAQQDVVASLVHDRQTSETSLAGIFAVGDVAAFPLNIRLPPIFLLKGSSRKIWWQFFGDNVGETIEIGNFDPKIATFWIDSGK
ncbi:hypothetical protein DVH24_008117 [Malus domestica]|uniref:FAD/NAD(P)-binding domain-containing protein n=1 Tax=Malus domestica TaxID=3750 RepID=A0A498JL88_MALDO|nr:hypothetical protein DVH24_008117 [Malus domestica]